MEGEVVVKELELLLHKEGRIISSDEELPEDTQEDVALQTSSTSLPSSTHKEKKSARLIIKQALLERDTKKALKIDKEFRQTFPEINKNEQLLNVYAATFKIRRLLKEEAGKIYLSRNYVCFAQKKITQPNSHVILKNLDIAKIKKKRSNILITLLDGRVYKFGFPTREVRDHFFESVLVLWETPHSDKDPDQVRKNKFFQQLFELNSYENLLFASKVVYWKKKAIPVEGTLFISRHYICFAASILLTKKKVICFNAVKEIKKEAVFNRIDIVGHTKTPTVSFGFSGADTKDRIYEILYNLWTQQHSVRSRAEKQQEVRGVDSQVREELIVCESDAHFSEQPLVDSFETDLVKQKWKGFKNRFGTLPVNAVTHVYAVYLMENNGISNSGSLYLTDQHLCFYSDVKQVVINLSDILLVEKPKNRLLHEKSIIQISTNKCCYIFGGFGLKKQMEAFEEINKAHKYRQNVRTLFGAELHVILQRENSDIPFVITSCCNNIEANGLSEEGIFRKSAESLEMDRVMEVFEDHSSCGGRDLELEFETNNPHVFACIIKTFLQTLPKPLVPYSKYPQFIELYEEHRHNFYSLYTHCSELVDEFPPPNRTLFLFLVHFLKKVHDNEENKMDASNLSIVFSPVLFRHPEGDLLKQLSDSVAFGECLRSLILSGQGPQEDHEENNCNVATFLNLIDNKQHNSTQSTLVSPTHSSSPKQNNEHTKSETKEPQPHIIIHSQNCSNNNTQEKNKEGKSNTKKRKKSGGTANSSGIPETSVGMSSVIGALDSISSFSGPNHFTSPPVSPSTNLPLLYFANSLQLNNQNTNLKSDCVKSGKEGDEDTTNTNLTINESQPQKSPTTPQSNRLQIPKPTLSPNSKGRAVSTRNREKANKSKSRDTVPSWKQITIGGKGSPNQRLSKTAEQKVKSSSQASMSTAWVCSDMEEDKKRSPSLLGARNPQHSFLDHSQSSSSDSDSDSDDTPSQIYSFG